MNSTFGFGYSSRQGAKAPSLEKNSFLKPLRLSVFAGGIPSFSCGCAAQRSLRPILFYGRIDSGKYFDGAQTLTVKFLQPRMRSSRMMRI